MPKSTLLFVIVAMNVMGCHALRRSPPRSPPPAYLSSCLGSEPAEPIIAAVIAEAQRRGVADTQRAVLETAADLRRGDHPAGTAGTAAETIRALGPTASSLLILAKVSGVRRPRPAGAPDACACQGVYLVAAADRGADISAVAGIECRP